MNLRLDSVFVSRFGGSTTPVVVNYAACYDFANQYDIAANVTTTVTVFGPSGEILVTSTTSTRWNGSGDSGGCGGFSINDPNLTHPRGVRFRVHVDYQYDDGVTGSIEKELPIPPG